MGNVVKSFKKGYRFRIYPNEEQKVLFAKTFGCTRFVYNQLLAKSIKDYDEYEQAEFKDERYKIGISRYNFIKEIPILKSEFEWLKEVSAVALQQTANDLGIAFKNFFHGIKTGHHIGYPQFKKKTNRQSFRLVGTAFNIRGNKFWISKSGEAIKVIWSRELPTVPTSVTISVTPTGEYYASFICNVIPAKKCGNKTIGLDVGITHFVTTSNGDKIDNPKWFRTKERQLRRTQQILARKQKGSNNRNKARIKVARIHQNISNQRNDFAHKLSRKIVNENQVIGIESLRIKNMIRNRYLSKSIGDASWATFFLYLSYKVRESQHSTLVMASALYPSSHLCSTTGARLDRKLKLSEREWDCPHCGETHDRDINAALNLRNNAILAHRVHKDAMDVKGMTILS